MVPSTAPQYARELVRRIVHMERPTKLKCQICLSCYEWKRSGVFYSSYKNDGIRFPTFKFMYNKYKGYDIEGDSSKSGGSK